MRKPRFAVGDRIRHKKTKREFIVRAYEDPVSRRSPDLYVKPLDGLLHAPCWVKASKFELVETAKKFEVLDELSEIYCDVEMLRQREGLPLLTDEQVQEQANWTTEGGKVSSTLSSGERDHFTGGGVRDAEQGKPRFDLLRPKRMPYERLMLTRWAALMERGARHYGARNWEQMHDNAALDRFRSSAARHFEQWLAGETDEDHAAAVYFNVQGAEYVSWKAST